MARDDDQRGKKSFSERDKDLRARKHRRDERDPPGALKQTSHEYRAYKNQLEKVFGGGGLPEAMKQKLEGSEVAVKQRAHAAGLSEIKSASPGSERLAALERFRAAHGFPEDEETLAALLELEEPRVVLEALQTVARLESAGHLKRGASLKMRVKTAMMTVDDDDVVAAAKALLQSL